jgi:prepilin-type N-terminal cleavage/methylation domain-containing protein
VNFAVTGGVRRTRHPEAGFSLTELLVVVAVLAVVTGVAIPSFATWRERMRLNQSAREVEREIQSARNKAVLNNRPMRVRFNCPAVGQLRVVELLGTPSVPAAADLVANRCDEATYPYPPADRDPATRPNLDGPVLRLDSRVRFGTVQTIEFWTNGSAHAGNVSPLPMLPVAGTSLTLTSTAGATTRTATITVNGIGKITLRSVQ